MNDLIAPAVPEDYAGSGPAHTYGYGGEDVPKLRLFYDGRTFGPVYYQSMQKVLFWARSRAGMSADEFRRYWIETHAPLARVGFSRLRSYEVNIVTDTLEGEPFVSGLAELYWETREAFQRDITSPAGKRVLDDVQNFASEAGPLLVDEHPVTPAGCRIRRTPRARRQALLAAFASLWTTVVVTLARFRPSTEFNASRRA